ncbi:MAG: histidine phosphatase family protein [Gammaproteobacteria bacterium]|nr:histidine phosphatase family protein [Gammaproteobacteria bacterium]MCW8923123.1 histidine phosphatase family protein [Gammaproteobacteria bacterium]
MSKGSKNRKLFIMRHGKANWEMDVDDLKRPLTERGVDEAKNIGHWLGNHGYRPDIIFTSNATRALTTSGYVAEGVGTSRIKQDARIYNASVEQLLVVLADIPTDIKRPMIVGHNPGFEDLLLRLANVGEHFYKGDKLMTTGTVAVLNMPDDWQQLNQQCGELVDVIRGGSL